jgi:hypothetical protein
VRRPRRERDEQPTSQELAVEQAPDPAVGEVDIRARPGRRTTLSIQKCLLEQALEIERKNRPTGPARSRR